MVNNDVLATLTNLNAVCITGHYGDERSAAAAAGDVDDNGNGHGCRTDGTKQARRTVRTD